MSAERNGPSRKAAKAAKSRERPAPAVSNPPRGSDDLREFLDADGAVALLNTSRPTFYRWLRSGRIKGVKVGRQWRFGREDVERLLRGEQPVARLGGDIRPLIEQLTARLAELGDRRAVESDGPAQQAIKLMVRVGLAMRGTDMHIEPTVGERVAVRWRVDGVLHPVVEFDRRLLDGLMQAWKTMAGCDLHEKDKPQDGRVAGALRDPQVDLRVCFVPSVLGESLVVRIFNYGAIQRECDVKPLGFTPRNLERIQSFLGAPCGLMIVTGPTGCGKTTTLYACLNHLANPERKIMTIEDPVEMSLPGVVQMGLKPQAGLTFPVAIRAMLRSAPNIMMVGEVRDVETLELCASAAATGHLVFTTLHASDSAAALKRMMDLLHNPWLIADATRLIVAQRLMRTLCPQCKKPQTPDAAAMSSAKSWALKGGFDWDAVPKQFHRPAGCPKCQNTGFRGRHLVGEVLEITPAIGEGLRAGASGEKLAALAVSEGMTTMLADGVRHAAAGVTTIQEVQRVLAVR